MSAGCFGDWADWGALAVRCLHWAFVLYMCVAPFSDDIYVLAAYVAVAPALWLHWVLNDDTCVLTLVEANLRGVSAERSFFHALVSPIYKISDECTRGAAWAFSVALWLVAGSRLWQLVLRERERAS